MAFCAPTSAQVLNPVDRLVAAVGPHEVRSGAPGVQALSRACGDDPACAFAQLRPFLSERVAFRRVEHPDTDSIRWVKSKVSVRRAERLQFGRTRVVLDRFGRKVMGELDHALSKSPESAIILDLRDNRGGDFERMLTVAGALIGPRRAALFLDEGRTREVVDLRNGDAGPPRVVSVVVGPNTASSAEILAALLRRYAAAWVMGERTAGKDHISGVIPVSHDWRVMVPTARVVVPGETLAGGLVPDGPIPKSLQRDLSRGR